VVRIGILGAGFMGSTHAKSYAQVKGAEIAGIYGLSENRAKPLADEHGTSWTTDLAKLIDDPTIDAIDVCLPGPQHRAVTEAALAAGKHVTLEKPITLTLEDADALVALAAKTNKVFMIAHVLRFWPEYMEIHKRATSGDYGKVISGLAYRRQPFPAWSQLFARSDLTGGAVIDQMIHDYDVLNWVIGAPQSVVAHGVVNTKSNGGIDQVQVMVNYGDASAVVDGGMMMPESYPFTSTFQILCERGAFEYNFRAGGRSVEMGGGTNELKFFPNEGDPEILKPDPEDPYVGEARYFVECIQKNEAPVRATPADARLALKTALAARRAVQSGRIEMV
jgi:predicted dehydrogenase